MKEHEPDKMLGMWAPELVVCESNQMRVRQRPDKNHSQLQACKNSRVKRTPSGSKLPKAPKWVKRHEMEWEKVAHKAQLSKHKAVLDRNRYFPKMTPRHRECLLIELCRYPARSDERPASFDLQSSAYRMPKHKGSFTGTCQVPMGVVWHDAPDVTDEPGGRPQFGL